nr:G85 [uncultured bacterium]
MPKFLPLLLAVLLVALQTGAVLHALGHLSDDERTGSPAVPQHAVCALCAAYAGSNGALATTPLAVVSLGTVAPVQVALRSDVYVPPFALPYQVRAPPALAAV